MARLIVIIGPRKENDSQGRYITSLKNKLLYCGVGNSSTIYTPSMFVELGPMLGGGGGRAHIRHVTM